jgi:hypothetical protein
MMTEIKVSETDNRIFIEVLIDGDSFGVSTTKDEAVQPAIDILMDNIAKERAGVTSHDISMALADYYIAKKND